MRQKKKGDHLGFVENTALGESDEPVDRVTVYRDTDLGKGQMQYPTPGKEPWMEPRTLVLVTTDGLAVASWGAALCSEPVGRASSAWLMQQGGLRYRALPAAVQPVGMGSDPSPFLGTC